MQKKPLKVFQSCCLFLKAGGIETLLVNWYKTADPRQISMDFGVSCSNGVDDDFVSYVRKRGNVFLVGKGRHLLLQKISYLINLYRLLKKGNYDIFQFHGGSGTVLFLENWVARLAGIKRRYFLTHGSLTSGFLNTWFSQWNLTYTHMHLLAVSEIAGKNFYGEKQPFIVLWPGIDTVSFAYNQDIRKQMRNKLGLEHNFVVGHVGRLSLEKNHLFLLDIFQEIYKKEPLARLVLVGGGPEEEIIRQKAHQLQLEKQILFMGRQKDVFSYYQAFDIFVLPSLFEGLPLSALEAQAAGLPCFLSETITRQVKVCNTTFLSLQQSPAVWSREILAKRDKFTRQDCAERVKQAGFDMSCFFAKMEQLYFQ